MGNRLFAFQLDTPEEIRNLARDKEWDKQVVHELQDLRYLSWTKTRKSSGTAGSFLKSYDDSGNVKLYYKLSDYHASKGIIGHECVNEIVVQRILDMLDAPHLTYRLIRGLIFLDGEEVETYLCQSQDFKNPGESKIPLEDYYQMERHEGERPMEFCLRMGWRDTIYKMLIADHICLNRDRHGANIEVLRNPKNKTIRLAPLFDQGLSLLFSLRDPREVCRFDVLEDRKVQSFIGTSSSLENLRLIPQSVLSGIPVPPEAVKETLRDNLLLGLDGTVNEAILGGTFEMIWRRWQSIGSL